MDLNAKEQKILSGKSLKMRLLGLY